MWNRKVIDDIKVRKMWHIEPELRRHFRKNRAKCSCWMCGNPRHTGQDSPKGLRERNLLLLHNDEISEALYS